jgi:hypothetical protein
MAYDPQTWANYPSTATPLSAPRLLHMEQGIDDAHTIAEAAAATAAAGTANGSVTAVKLSAGVGANGQVLSMVAGALGWTTPGGLTATTVKTANYTAAAGDYIPVDTTAGTITITLPAAPPDGTQIAIKQIAGGNTTSIVRSGSAVFNVAAGATSLTLSATGIGVQLRYNAATSIWYSLDSFPLSAVGSAFAPATGPVPADYVGQTDRKFFAVDRTQYVANATLALADAGREVDVNSATAVTITVPPTTTVSWQDGTVIGLNALNSGIVSVAPGAGVTFIPSGTWKLRQLGSPAKIRKLPGGGAALPSTNLLMRYRADDLPGANGSAVSSWPDSSGNGLPAAVQATATNQPTLLTNSLNGHKVVQFGGIDDFLALSGSTLAIGQNKPALSIFVAYYYNTAVTGTRTLFSLSSGTSSTSVRALLQQRDSSGVMGGGGRRLDANSGAFVAGAASVAGTAEIATLSLDWTNSDLLLYRNGTLGASNTSFQTAGNSENTISLAGTIGSNLAGTAEFCNVRIAEILAYSAADAITRAAVHTYLAATYGITAADANPAGDTWVIQGDITL